MKVCVPATSANLGPGFDVLGLALDLKNIVEIKESSFQSISIRGYGQDVVNFKINNMFVRIFSQVFEKLTSDNTKFNFKFENNVPLSSGLGSSSTVIVGAIAGAYKMAGVTLSKESLLNHALKYEHHPDNIAPAVHGGFVVSMVEKEKVYVHKKNISKNLKAVILKPDVSVNTEESRKVLPSYYNQDDTIFNLSRCSYLVSCFFNEDWKNLRIASNDKLHQEQRMALIPGIVQARKIALENGALMSTLSGSGPTLFNLVYENDANRIYSKFREVFNKSLVRILNFDNEGTTFGE
ncbi:MAG: Homoserine kinase (EC [uncultured Campylobacterales bacterium]|uniref:Homoserine kinase n=1 Tax=uncultured Campylobacterales bacterium TaxID=352960 RepID=A0A6S6SIY8_9BACT|nr:MAG: Homoserine kinase (EC [uncultured Campylobacterales bacterium]